MMNTNMNPTLIIGLGGAGTEALCQAKQLLEDSGCSWPAYLAVDSDMMSMQQSGLSYGEVCDISDMHLQIFLRNPELIPADYLRDAAYGLPGYSLPMYGAGAVRRLGRFMLLNQAERVEKQIFNALGRACDAVCEKNGALDKRAWLDVFILAGACGGTGAGALIDIAYMTAEIAEKRIGMDARVRCMPLMPDPDFNRLNIPLRQVMIPSAWALLKELESWMDPGHARRFRQQYTRDFIVDTQKMPYNECLVTLAEPGHGIYGSAPRTAAAMICGMVNHKLGSHMGMSALYGTEYGPDVKALRADDDLPGFRSAYEEAEKAGDCIGCRLWSDEELDAALIRQPGPEPEDEKEELKLFARCLFTGLYKKTPPRMYTLNAAEEGVRPFLLMTLNDYSLAPVRDDCYAVFRKFCLLPAEQKDVMRKLAAMRERQMENEIMTGNLIRYAAGISNIRTADAAIQRRMSDMMWEDNGDQSGIYEFYQALRGVFAVWLDVE